MKSNVPTSYRLNYDKKNYGKKMYTFFTILDTQCPYVMIRLEFTFVSIYIFLLNVKQRMHRKKFILHVNVYFRNNGICE